ncbi:hypothetical protein GQX74_015734 [Glossina fuscipes]|nr:hypothetical protein GQX74_015734 [Glossina fuscipes]
MLAFLYNREPVRATIEDVRDGSTVRASLLSIPFVEEARYFVEARLLQREVKIYLESVKIGTILHPSGNIYKSLFREALAKCVDCSVAVIKDHKFKNTMQMFCQEHLDLQFKIKPFFKIENMDAVWIF